MTDVVQGGTTDVVAGLGGGRSRFGMAELVRAAGRSTGLVALAFFIATGLFVLSWLERDVAALTAPLGVLVTAIYAGGGIKAWAKLRNGASTAGPAPASR